MRETTPPPARSRFQALLPADPRWLQIAALSGLLLWGITRLSFDITPGRAALLIGSALAAQALFTALWRLPVFEPKSALISGLSLCLLLRTNAPAVAVLAALIAIGSKFAIRVRGKHVFNPTNIGIAAAILLTGQAWVSPAQWGHAAFAAFAFAAAGALVVSRAARWDVTLALLAAHAAFLIGRSLSLGEPMAIPLHRLESGGVLLFAFFMISDPKSTPDSRLGRILFAAAVAAGAHLVAFRLFAPNGLIWSLAALSPLVPVLDRLLPGGRYAWKTGGHRKEPHMSFSNPLPQSVRQAARGAAVLAAGAAIAAVASTPAQAFCGFYVARADAKLFNRASQVVLVRDGDRTVITMAADFKGEPKEFAMVIPVPTFVQKGQIHVADRAVLEHLDGYSAPRLVEYFDGDPCALARREMQGMKSLGYANAPAAAEAKDDRARRLGVKIEAQYTVGEYDILILSAKESGGLETWLRENGYRIPDGASAILSSYLKQGMKFFVARVNLAEQSRLGFSYLRPIQVAYESPKFMLPIRLGTVNASGSQDLYVYALTRGGRVETTNYRTVKLPSDAEVPLYVKDEFTPFYKALFSRAVQNENREAVFLEYAWDMGWCDPCAADPLSQQELRSLGVFWLGRGNVASPGGGAQNVFLTRLHVRYDAAHFPEDLVFQETSDRSNFQGRYIVRHPWAGENWCPEMPGYLRALREQQEQQARTLAGLTGWELAKIRDRMDLVRGPDPRAEKPWWAGLWD